MAQPMDASLEAGRAELHHQPATGAPAQAPHSDISPLQSVPRVLLRFWAALQDTDLAMGPTEQLGHDAMTWDKSMAMEWGKPCPPMYKAWPPR